MSGHRSKSRRTSSGRIFPSSHNDNSLTSSLDNTLENQAGDLDSSPESSYISSENSEGEYKINSNETLREIREFIKARGFSSIVDLWRTELKEIRYEVKLHEEKGEISRKEREIRQWLSEDGISELLSIYVEHKRL